MSIHGKPKARRAAENPSKQLYQADLWLEEGCALSLADTVKLRLGELDFVNWCNWRHSRVLGEPLENPRQGEQNEPQNGDTRQTFS